MEHVCYEYLEVIISLYSVNFYKNNVDALSKTKECVYGSGWCWYNLVIISYAQHQTHFLNVTQKNIISQNFLIEVLELFFHIIVYWWRSNFDKINAGTSEITNTPGWTDKPRGILEHYTLRVV